MAAKLRHHRVVIRISINISDTARNSCVGCSAQHALSVKQSKLAAAVDFVRYLRGLVGFFARFLQRVQEFAVALAGLVFSHNAPGRAY